MGNLIERPIKRTIIITLDSVGVGELPDAAEYGDAGSNTLANIASFAGGLDMPNFASLGLGNIITVSGVPPNNQPLANYGKMAEVSPGKDTVTGHWELMGIQLRQQFPLYPNGFPSEIIQEFERRIGQKALGNKAASGTEIIEELGEEHLRTGNPIVYTSADSVLQIAAHQDIIPLEELYRICRIAREMLTGDHNVGRVIARPFTGPPGAFVRTEWRRDFSLKPPTKSVLNYAEDAGLPVHGIGKISDIFAGSGVTTSVHTGNNMEGVDQILIHLKEFASGIIFANLVDFDMLWGHRNNAAAYARGLEDLDRRMPEIIGALASTDLLIITADHGCDPTTSSTDHSREFVPLLVYGPGIKQGSYLGTRASFADIGKTLAEAMNFAAAVKGVSFWPQIN